MTFALFGPDDATCSGAVAFTTPLTVSGNGSYNSAHFTTTKAGAYRWVVTYSGDAANNPVGPTSCSDPSESVMVSPFTAALTTTASPGVPVGGAIHDTAHLTGFNPTGTITFRLSGPTDTFCSGSAVTTATVTVAGSSGEYNSPDFMPAAPGTYRWQASYSGDSNNQATPITACLDPNEAVTITAGKASPTITTTASASVPVGGSVTDQATIAGGNSPKGTITFNLFGPGDPTCSAMPAVTSMATVTGVGSFTSGAFVTTGVGTYHWTAAYGGDANNNPATSACGAANESVVVTPATPTLTTTASAATTVGAAIHDTATLSGGFSPTGTITFNLYGPDDATCSSTAVFTNPVTVAGAGSYNSASFNPAAAGTYRWRASYSGDANDNAVGPTSCLDPNESVTITTVAPPAVTVTKTADAAVALPGAQDGYTVTFTNTGTAAATLGNIKDTLPAGFTYVAGSTTGGITADPTVTGQALNWIGTFSVPATGTLKFHFLVKASSVTGHYTNDVGAVDPAGMPVASVTLTAPIDVATTVSTPAFPVEGLPIALGLGATALLLIRRRVRSARA